MCRILYYAPEENTTKHILFLEKNGYDLIKCSSSVELIKNIAGTSLVITTTEDALYLISKLNQEVPIIVLSKSDTRLEYTKTSNKVFYRSEVDPLFTLLETVKLLLKT